MLEDETMEDAEFPEAGFDFSFCFILSKLSFELLFEDFELLSREEDVEDEVVSFSCPVFELDLLLRLLLCLSFSFVRFDTVLLIEPPTNGFADEDAKLFTAGFKILFPLGLPPIPVITELDVLGAIFDIDEFELFEALLDFLCLVVNDDDDARTDEDTIVVDTDDAFGNANLSVPDDTADVLGRVFTCVLLSFSGDDGESDDPVS